MEVVNMQVDLDWIVSDSWEISRIGYELCNMKVEIIGQKSIEFGS